jgi:hypothetical protein
LYKGLSGNDYKLSFKEESALDDLDDFIENTSDNISTWSQPDYYSAVDDPNQVPNLTGVPESHSWWTNKKSNQRRNIIILKLEYQPNEILLYCVNWIKNFKIVQYLNF